jgi:hypothetical protein
MSKAFNSCVKRGGRVRTKKLFGGRYMHVCSKDGKSYVCFKYGKSYAGHVKSRKDAGKQLRKTP